MKLLRCLFVPVLVLGFFVGNLCFAQYEAEQADLPRTVEPKRVLVVGTGYVGLVTGACFAHLGHHVTCLDIDDRKIETLNQGQIPFYEPRLAELVSFGLKADRLSFTTDYKKAVQGQDLYMVSVPTPTNPDDGSCDLKYVLSAVQSIATHAEKDVVIVIKSTVPPTAIKEAKHRFETVVSSLGKSIACEMASNPEFLKEGSAVQDCLFPDRIIIGAHSDACRDLLLDLYAPYNSEVPRLCMRPESATMVKYAANAMLALRISFMNELSGLCEDVGASILDIEKGIGSDNRIGSRFLQAGIGYGGSCFPKDTRALIALGQLFQRPMSLVDATTVVNQRQKHVLYQKMVHHFSTKGGLQGRQIGVLGLAFKPNTDDIREAPSLELIRDLIREEVIVRVFDPIAQENVKKVFGDHPQIVWCSHPYEVAKEADALALVTEWDEFKKIDFRAIGGLMRERTMFDGRNFYSPAELKELGFTYYGIGF